MLRLQLAESLALHLSFRFPPRRFSSRGRFAFKLERERVLLGKEFCSLLLTRSLLFVFAVGLGLLRQTQGFGSSGLSSSHCGWRHTVITLNKGALFTDLNLDRPGAPAGISLLDFTGLLARDRDLLFGLFLAAPVRASQGLQQRCFVGLGQTILRRLLAHTSGTQLLKQHFRRHLQFGSKFLNINTSHSVP